MKLLLLLIFLMPLFSAPLFAQQHAIDVFLEDCMEADPSTVGMVNCYEEAEKKWDEELNKTYKQLMAAADENTKPKLKAAQLAWIKLRDAEFEFIAYLYGQMPGTMFRTFSAGRRVTIIRNRVMELKSYYDDLLMSRQ